MKRVVITRALPEANRTALVVAHLGADPVVAPLFTIAPRAFDTDVEEAQALLFTSGAAVRAFSAAASARDVKVLAVGEATAAVAHSHGFRDVVSANSDSRALARLAATQLDRRGGPVIHISGADVAGDLVGALAADGFEAERRVAYEAVAAAQLPVELNAPYDVILFHSARAAQTFARLGAPHAAHAAAACLSPAIARAAENSPLGRVAWAQLIISPAPRESALIRVALAPPDASA